MHKRKTSTEVDAEVTQVTRCDKRVEMNLAKIQYITISARKRGEIPLLNYEIK